MRQLVNPEQFLILVVDDAPTNLKVLQKILEQVGYTLTFATNGKQALDRVETAQPDLILLDLMMPEMDGLEVCQHLKQSEAAHIPIIFLTASHEREHLLQAFEQGAVDYVTKPFNKQELLARIKTNLELKYCRDRLDKQAQRDLVIERITQTMARSFNLNESLQQITIEVQNYLRADRVMVCQFTPLDRGTVIAEATATAGQPLFRKDRTSEGWLEQRYSSVLAPEFRVLDELNPDYLSLSDRSLIIDWQVKTELILPLLQQETLWGVLVAHHSNNATSRLTSELNYLNQIANHIAIAIQQADLYQQLKSAKQDLRRMADLDSLTQINNHRLFNHVLSQEWLRLQREQQPLAILLCDIDYFRRYNYCYGHQAGDDCLAQVAQAIGQTIRRPADLVARYGGEEFAIILPNTGSDGATQVAQLIQAAIAQLSIPHPQSEISEFVTLSIGIVSVVPSAQFDPHTMLNAVDRALYQAKANGRNQYVLLENL